MNNLVKNLNNKIYGQEYAVEKCNDVIIKMYFNMNKIFNKERPAGTLFLLVQLALEKLFWLNN